MQIPSWAPLAVFTISLLPPVSAQNSEAGLASARAGSGTAVPAARMSRTSAASLTAGDAPLLLLFLEHVLGDEGCGHGCRPAGVEREMRDDLAQLGLCHAVVDRAFEMAGELLLAAERDQGGDDDQAAVALRQARPLPDIAEQHRLGVVDQVRDDVADGIARRGGLRLGHLFLRVMLRRINHRQPTMPPPPRTRRSFGRAAMPAQPCRRRATMTISESESGARPAGGAAGRRRERDRARRNLYRQLTRRRFRVVSSPERGMRSVAAPHNLGCNPSEGDTGCS